MWRSTSIFRDPRYQSAKRRLRGLLGLPGPVQAPRPPYLRTAHAWSPANPNIVLTDGGIEVAFACDGERIRLVRIGRPGETPFVRNGQIGNPLVVVVLQGRYTGVHGMETFHINKRFDGDRRLLLFLEHDHMPMQLSLDISVEGNVITWLGQAIWNGSEPLDADLYFPLLSRVTFDSPSTDRAIFPQISGSTRGPLGDVNYCAAYLGTLSSPVFLVEGSGRGLAVLDDNRADLAVDPGAAARRVYLFGNRFPPSADLSQAGGDGPFTGICHTRRFRPVGDFGGDPVYNAAEVQGPDYMRKVGDGVDLGPIRCYAYTGNWQTGADWLRGQRAQVPMRSSPAEWYRDTTFLGEGDAEPYARAGRSLLELPEMLETCRTGGADLLHIRGFHDGELLGVDANVQNRGDYLFPAQNLGGADALRCGIRAAQRAGGRILLYVEGLIVWKRGRIGRSRAEQWQLREEDGSPIEHHRGFWHACPACADYQEWLARTLAETIRITGADGFFIDSSLATANRRCFHPGHAHPHPDVWNWGVRGMLRRVREEVDKVDPRTVLLVEGCGDLGREFADGFVSHTHVWTGQTFTEPLVRFLHPEMRAFESWGGSGSAVETPLETMRASHVWNAVHGHRIYSHAPLFEHLSQLALRTRRCYNAYPEITANPLSVLDVGTRDCIAQLFDGPPVVLTVGETSGKDVRAEVRLPVHGAVLLDRTDGSRVQLRDRTAELRLHAYELRAFEVRP